MVFNRRLRFTQRLVVLIVCFLAVGQLYWTYVYKRKQTPSEKSTDRYAALVTHGLATNDTGQITRPGVPILLWWDSVYNSVDEIKTCGKGSCRISNNRSLKGHPDTKGFIFYGSHFKPYNLPLPRQKDHIWALFHEESPRNAHILSHGNTLDYFNFTATYNRNSDYPITTQWLQCADWLQDTRFILPLVDKNRLRGRGLAPILYIHSDCGVPSDRDQYVEILQQYIQVDSYGACQNNKELPERLRFRQDMAALDDKEFYQFVARYKFTLAFENYVCEDYITEKLWRPIRVGSVPIVFGAPNIRDYLPSNKSAILVEDFQDVEDLANYIQLLDTNDRLYLEYLNYKEEPINNIKLLQLLLERDWEPKICSKQSKLGTKEDLRTKWLSSLKKSPKPKFDSIFHGFECFLCNAVTDMLQRKRIRTRSTRKHGIQYHYTCPSPRQFDKYGHYSVYSKAWSADWLYGKYEAIVLDSLYRQNKICTEKEFLKLVELEYKEDI